MPAVEGFHPMANFRDLGGYAAADGRVVRPGLIFRSAGLYRLNEEERAAFERLGIRAIMELRTTGEVEADPDPVFEGVRRVHYAGHEFGESAEIDFSPAGMHRLGDGARDQYDKLLRYYRTMSFDNEAFRNLFELLEAGEVPVVFHCASGKDRTGVAAMLILLALGVPEETVIEDYLLSNEFRAEKIAASLREYADHIASDPLAGKLNMLENGVLRETAEMVLGSLRERYGSYEAYLAAEFGLTGERLAAFRDRYLCDPAGETGDVSSVLKQPSRTDRAAELRAEEASRAKGAGSRIRILFTSDVHGAVTGRSYVDDSPVPGGFARLATLIAELRDERTILLDGGDTIEGSPLSSYHVRHRIGEVFPATRAMAAIGYDYELLGNHDFNFGREVFERHLELCGAEGLTGNAHADGTPLAPPYVIREIAGLRVALVGATTSAIPRWEQPDNIEGMEFADALGHARSAVSEARAKGDADLVVVAYHGGFECDPETDEPLCDDDGENQAWRMLREIEGIDVLLTGHQHRSMCGIALGPDGREVAYVQPGSKGAQLACVDIDVEDRSALPVLIEVDAEADADVLDLVAEEDEVCQTWLDQPLGSSLVDLTVDDDLAGEVEKSQLVTFLNLVQLEATGAELSATAIFPGATGFAREITMRDLVSTYRFANTLAVKRVTGAQLRSYLERCAEYFALDGEGAIVRAPGWADPPADFNYDMVDGIDYTIDLTRPAGERIVSLTRAGRPVEDDDSFTLAVNSYRAAGGGGFPMIAEAPTVSENLTDMVELIANYILAHSPIDFEPVSNIRVITSKEQS